MSNATDSSNATPTIETPHVPAHKHGHPVKVTENGVLFELQEFDKDSANAGFVFYNKSFLNKTALEANLDEETILMCVNRHYNFAMRQKANNSIPSDADAKAALIAKGEVLLIDIPTAKSYKPGERDLTSLAGIGKRLAEFREELQEARAAGDTARVNAIREQAKLLVIKQQELIAKDMGDLG